jgi:preprotein translocase subunit SecA
MSAEEVNWSEFEKECRLLFGFVPLVEEIEPLEKEAKMDYILDRARAYLKQRVETIGEANFKSLTNWIMLSALDTQWKDHLLSMDKLKEGIGLRGYAQKDPLREYQREGFEMFEEMVARIRTDSLASITNFKVNYHTLENPDETDSDTAYIITLTKSKRKPDNYVYTHGGENSSDKGGKTEVRTAPKIGRNDPCPCGSGKKYKFCCGAK